MRSDQKREVSTSARPAWRRYFVALLFTVVAAAGVAACVEFLALPAFLLYIAAIGAAQAYGGIGPGMVSASAALGLSLWAFLPPHDGWATEGSPWWFVVCYYGAVLIGYLVSNRRGGIRRQCLAERPR